MTKSMTAFAREESGNVSWEIRSVNHRYLDVTFKIPETCRSLEPALRNVLRRQLNRGKLDCLLRLNYDSEETDDFRLDESRLLKLKTAVERANTIMGNTATIDVLDLFRWPGVLKEADTDQAELEGKIHQTFEKALASLSSMRQREGNELKRIICEKLAGLEIIVQSVRDEAPAILARQKQKLDEKLSELALEIDGDRLEQELVYLAQKSDIQEELDRLNAHVLEVRASLEANGAIGRRLDFLMQELNREANTLSSKAIAANTSIQVVELKVIIEQMREQVQNIE